MKKKICTLKKKVPEKKKNSSTFNTEERNHRRVNHLAHNGNIKTYNIKKKKKLRLGANNVYSVILSSFGSFRQFFRYDWLISQPLFAAWVERLLSWKPDLGALAS